MRSKVCELLTGTIYLAGNYYSFDKRPSKLYNNLGNIVIFPLYLVRIEICELVCFDVEVIFPDLGTGAMLTMSMV